MKRAQLLAALVIMACAVGPASAAGPVGEWTCEVTGSFVGRLSLEDASYSFTSATASGAERGSYTGRPALLAHDPAYTPGPAVQPDAGYLSITSGPLDVLGIDLGFYNAGVTPASLVFASSAGKAMHCTPA